MCPLRNSQLTQGELRRTNIQSVSTKQFEYTLQAPAVPVHNASRFLVQQAELGKGRENPGVRRRNLLVCYSKCTERDLPVKSQPPTSQVKRLAREYASLGFQVQISELALRNLLRWILICTSQNVWDLSARNQHALEI